MAEVITTLHPENDDTIDLYPNIKKENIPANAIDTAKIANESVTENKLDPALQARLADEVVIVELSGTSGVISESSFNKLVNAEIGLIKLDNELYYKAYIKEMGSPAYPVYHFVILNQYAVNESNNDYLVRKDVAVNSSTRYWVKYTDTKSLTFYNEATETILIDHIDTGDLHSDGAIDTDAGITAETESNIAGVVMDDSDVYANEIYLGDGELQLSGKLENLEFEDESNFYHLASFDTKISQNSNIVTIQRQTAFVDLGTLNYTYDSTTKRFITEDISSVIAILGSTTTPGFLACSIYNCVPGQAQVDNLNLDMTMSQGTGVYAFVRIRNLSYTDPVAFKNAMNGVILQYKHRTFSYQEQVIYNSPLTLLDKNGSAWLYNEWLKTLNIWNEDWVVGGLNNDGSINSSATTRRTTSFIKVKPNTTYYQTSPDSAYDGRIAFYNSNQALVLYDANGIPLNTKTFTTPANAYYVRITFGGSYGTTYNHNIMILKGDHPYPYQKYNGRIIHEVDVEPVTLWTNLSPNADFGGQITVRDMSIYKYIVIEYKDDPASDTASKYLKCKYEAGKAFYIEHPDGMRLVDFINSTTIDFDTPASNYIIPVAIYGTNIL